MIRWTLKMIVGVLLYRYKILFIFMQKQGTVPYVSSLNIMSMQICHPIEMNLPSGN